MIRYQFGSNSGINLIFYFLYNSFVTKTLHHVYMKANLRAKVYTVRAIATALSPPQGILKPMLEPGSYGSFPGYLAPPPPSKNCRVVFQTAIRRSRGDLVTKQKESILLQELEELLDAETIIIHYHKLSIFWQQNLNPQ